MPIPVPKSAVSPKVVNHAAAAIEPLRKGGAHAGPFGGRAGGRPAQYSLHAGDAAPRVLIVDPDDSARALLSATLAKAGYEVVTACGAAEARRQLSPGRPLPVAVVAEGNLVGEDGFALCGQIRAEHRTAHLPVLLLSVDNQHDHREMASAVGADDFLVKPVFARDVVSLIDLKTAPRAGDGTFQLSTHALPLSHALRALLAGFRSGRIRFREGRTSVSFRQGHVIDATFDATTGAPALLRALLLDEGDYTVGLGPLVQPPRFSFSLRELVTAAFPQLLRWEQLRARSVPLDAVLAVDFGQLAKNLGSLPDEVNDIVRLFDGVRTVRDVLMDSAAGELTTLEVATRLYAMGVVAPVSVQQNPPGRSAPALLIGAGRNGLPVPVLQLAPELMRQSEAPAPIQVFGGGAPAELDASLEAAVLRAAPIPLTEVVHLASQEALVNRYLASSAPLFEPVPQLHLPSEAEFFGDVAPTSTSSEEPVSEVLTIPGQRRVGRTLGAVALVAALAFAAGHVASRLSRAPAGASQQAPVDSPVDTNASASEPAKTVQMEELSLTVPAAPTAPALTEGLALYDAHRYRQAALVLTKFVQQQPASGEGWLLLGLARFDAGDAAGAEEAALKAAALRPASGRAAMLLATVYLNSGHRQKAADELRRYLTLEPAGHYAQDARQLLSAL